MERISTKQSKQYKQTRIKEVIYNKYITTYGKKIKTLFSITVYIVVR